MTGPALKRVGRKLRYLARHAAEPFRPEWPRPPHALTDPPKLLLLLTPPNSGSTAIADYLGQSPEVARLEPRCEGQWLVKGLRAADRWRADKLIDWGSVRAVWFDAIVKARRENSAVAYVIEKSPPNMMRHEGVVALFERHAVVVNNRNPYANIASMGYKYEKFARLSAQDRLTRVGALAEGWLARSRVLQAIVSGWGYPMLSYEAFCADPKRIVSLFGLTTDAAAPTSTTTVKVKDYPAQGIVDMNARQVAMLTDDERSRIRDVLAPHSDLLDFFGYAPGWNTETVK